MNENGIIGVFLTLWVLYVLAILALIGTGIWALIHYVG